MRLFSSALLRMDSSCVRPDSVPPARCNRNTGLRRRPRDSNPRGRRRVATGRRNSPRLGCPNPLLGRRSAAGIVLSQGHPSRLARWPEYGGDLESPLPAGPGGFESPTNPTECYVGGFTIIQKEAKRCSLAGAASRKRYATLRPYSRWRSAGESRLRHTTRHLHHAHVRWAQEIACVDSGKLSPGDSASHATTLAILTSPISKPYAINGGLNAA
jgi:hypothetical protein